jgi:hypothetical protein
LELSESKNPSPIKNEVIGTHPLWFADEQPVTIFVRLKDRKDSTPLLLIVWDQYGIGWRAIFAESEGKTFRTHFVASSKNRFSGFHLGFEKTVTLSFKINQRGIVSAIEFQTAHGKRVLGESEIIRNRQLF